jgi:hypothetical protein
VLPDSINHWEAKDKGRVRRGRQEAEKKKSCTSLNVRKISLTFSYPAANKLKRCDMNTEGYFLYNFRVWKNVFLPSYEK